MYFIGIDAGNEGAVAILDVNSSPVSYIELTHKKGETDIFELWRNIVDNCVDKYGRIEPLAVLIEEPNRGRAGAKNNRNQRRNGLPSIFQHVGQLQGMFKMKGVEPEMVHPLTWQAVINRKVDVNLVDDLVLDYEKRGRFLKLTKAKSIAFCLSNDYPVPKTPRSQVYKDGVADAWCIARVAWERENAR